MQFKDVHPNPASDHRIAWTGEFFRADETPADDFTEADVKRLVRYVETAGDKWNGESVGVAELRDGRYISWAADYGPTGTGFVHDAYGGTADINFASTAEAATNALPEQSRQWLARDGHDGEESDALPLSTGDAAK